MIRRFKPSFAFSLLLACSLLASSASPQVPQGAVDELHARWQSLPGSQTHDLVVLRAWKGKTPPDANSFFSTVETWCFETQPEPKSGISQGSERMVWVVTRSGGDTGWVASPLMVMSSTWPYEACLGKAP